MVGRIDITNDAADAWEKLQHRSAGDSQGNDAAPVALLSCLRRVDRICLDKHPYTEPFLDCWRRRVAAPLVL